MHTAAPQPNRDITNRAFAAHAWSLTRTALEQVTQMRSAILAVLLVAASDGCMPGPTLPSHSAFLIGASRTEIQQDFSSPDQIHTFHKTSEGIWGAIEAFWITVPLGSSVEVWSYQSQSPTMGIGRTELYFVDGSEKVNGKAFSPDGVVYESGPKG